MAYICIDFGDKRIGIAKSDGVLATSVGTIVVTGMNDAVRKTAAMINEHNGHVVVIGMPKNMDSTRCYLTKGLQQVRLMFI
jgi:putative transcription antitermination factor YqgF